MNAMDRQSQSGHYRVARITKRRSLTIMGFVLFLTGAIFVFAGAVDLLSRIDDAATVVFLLGGLALYHLGKGILNHCATLQIKKERRNHLTTL
ncbi:hypothetical protein [Alteromonas lipotrueiana]|uniref:hypothetical protein n=1 Tax=Alteromonas lipotrueiana TaxID=2803815 RepID=UPI001C440F08|nr:hypothetical protein [Alteromonas lipotrueiana]